MALVEVLNSLGVSLSANPTSSHSTQQLGSRLTIAALAIQLSVIVIFVILTAIFHRRCIKANVRANAVSTLLIILYLSMSLILIRCMYRLVEHLGSTTVRLDNPESLVALSPILRYEWYFYIFEASLMLINSVIWNIWNPGRYLPTNSHVYLAQDGKTELEGKIRTRTLGRALLALLTFGFFFREKEEDRPFLELNSFSGSSHQTK